MSLHAAPTWRVESISGKAEAIDVLAYSKPIFTIKEGMNIPQSFLIDMPGKNTSLVLKNKNDIRVAFKGPAMFGLGQYKNMNADVIVVRGEAEVLVPYKAPIFKIDTSSVGLDLEGASAATIRSIEKGDNFETYICVSAGSGFIRNVFEKPIQKATQGQSFNIWKGRVIEKSKCDTVKVEIPKPLEGKDKIVKIKKPEKPVPPPVKQEKPKNEEETFDLSEIQRELFGTEVTTDAELMNQLVKGEKKDIIEKDNCKDCAEGNARVMFMLPEGFNIVAPNVYPDRTLPAIFYNLTEKGAFTSKLVSDFKLIKYEEAKSFEYEIKAGTYGVSVVKGPVFKIELKEKQKQRINLSSFINPGYRLEIEVPLTKEFLTSFEDKTMPIFVYPGNYNFKIYKGKQVFEHNQIVKPGSVQFIEKKETSSK